VGLAILTGGLSHATGQTPPPPDGRVLLLKGGTVYTSPAENPLPDGAVLIRSGKIAAVGPRDSVAAPRGAPSLDCSGRTVVPGFWNSHVHFIERKWADAANTPAPELASQLQTMLTRYGFTTVFDIGSFWQNTRRLRDRIESGEIPGPRIRSTGELLLGKGWSPPDVVLSTIGVMPFPLPEAGDAAEAAAVSKRLLDAGTDGLKFYAAAPFPPHAGLPSDVIRAIVGEAHRRNKPVFVHPTTRDGVLAAVEGGADVIAHTTPQTGPWDDAVLAAMRQARVALIPTLKVWKHLLRHDRDSLGEASVRTSTGQLRAWTSLGGVVLFGTDVGGIDDYDPTEEYALMGEAGMTFRQILASLTTAPAAKFGEPDRLGRIAPGLVADLVVLDADPARDPRAFAGVRYSIRNGRIIYSAAR